MKPLSGWKQIAVHLNQGVRTVQRWEILGLPVHRMGKGKRAQVIAFAEEPEAWERTASRRLLDEIQDLKNQVAKLQAEVRSLKAERTRPSSAKEMRRQSREMRETANTMRKSVAKSRATTRL
jgi:uncharacterized protein YlxW (UPF0749 family)